MRGVGLIAEIPGGTAMCLIDRGQKLADLIELSCEMAKLKYTLSQSRHTSNRTNDCTTYLQRPTDYITSLKLMVIVFVCKNSSNPYFDPNLPNPDFFHPNN
jgi:hypothetical protein